MRTLNQGYTQYKNTFGTDASGEITPEQFIGDLAQLLGAYDVLRQKIGASIVDVASAPTEDDFQEAATALSKAPPQKQYEPPPGPIPPSPKSLSSETSSCPARRNTKILSPLLADRLEALKGRGLEISSEKLVSLYRAKLEEE
jgi:hypothetical protein